ncbi:hypothetical protein UO65_5542 [Actinokineospora spheciospongiae]|uniref:Uncharacterized protein n=1 Tax=Actinokineospora spheciospongiae TaxID=909613 RepID=W7IEB2_9PSEU|nr:hypothetical protein UO65_5542 [Actinokineospora spheciospongiae]
MITGLISGFTGAWKLGMPWGHLALLMAVVLIVVVLVRWPDLQDAATRRF